MYTEDFRRQAVADYNNGDLSIEAVAERYGVSPSSLKNWRRKYSSSDKSPKSSGRPKTFTDEHRALIVSLKKDNPDLSRDHFADLVYRSTGIRSSGVTIWRLLREEGVDLKGSVIFDRESLSLLEKIYISSPGVSVTNLHRMFEQASGKSVAYKTFSSALNRLKAS